ncbi:MAG: CrcB family protein [Microlunatus sp.]|nr:CrcB family protein [Microlunatus sp.]MDN5770860.1 CrcB family protein [Microlunatus sp.]
MSDPNLPIDPTLPVNPTLPADPDLEADVDSAARPRASHLSLSNIALVVAGGAVGTGLRYLLGTHAPTWDGVPVATVAINVVGAFVLGALLMMLTQRSPGSVWARRVRLGGGTGVLGGFTTYSALATDTVVLAAAHPGRAVAYALTTVTVGGVASLLGIWVGRRARPAASKEGG